MSLPPPPSPTPLQGFSPRPFGPEKTTALLSLSELGLKTEWIPKWLLYWMYVLRGENKTRIEHTSPHNISKNFKLNIPEGIISVNHFCRRKKYL
jgi:hypothetical protein